MNAELYVALIEIEMESVDQEQGFVLAVIHTVREGDGIDNNVVGNFLLNNSKEFAAKLHHKLMYQDLLRFACATLTSENSDRTKTFLKTNLRGFAKGNKNVPFFIKFASLPIDYLNKFDRFCRLYEEGSLNGMKMSFRKRMGVNKELKSKEIIKLELPLKFLKSHLNLSQASREELLNKVLEKKITLPQYESELRRIAEIQDVKGMVEKISGQNFEDSKSSYVELLSDDVLEEFAGAKSLPSGPNLQYLKLVNHVKGLNSQFPVDAASEKVAKMSFQLSDKMHLSSVNKLVKDHDIVVFVKGSDKSLNDKFEFSMKQHVMENSAIGVYIDPNNDSVQLGLEYLEEGQSDVKIEPVFVKKTKTVVKDGFRKEFFPMFSWGM